MAIPSIATGISLLAWCAAAAAAAPAPPRPVVEMPNAQSAGPRAALLRPISLRVSDQPLGDVLAFINQSSGVTLAPLWLDDEHAEGLDPEARVTLTVHEAPALRVIERVLAQAGADPADNTWQIAPSGACQLGPGARLNRFRTIEVYRVDDLLTTAPDYTDAPDIDLQSVLQSGGNRSPFRNDAAERQATAEEERATRAEQLGRLIQELVEPEQWVDAGGSAATVRIWDGMLVVHAPGYIHRQIEGGR